VSNIDHRLWNLEEHAGSVTAPLRQPTVTGSFVLSPDEGEASCTHPNPS
jgi:hypothetical protein